MKIIRSLKNLFAKPVTQPAAIVSDDAELQEKLRLAKAAHLAAARRISAFGLEQPELYRLYFTKAGDKQRQELRHETA